MVGEIAYAPDFVKSLDKLVVKMYEKEYFGFIDSSFVYTNKIYEYIESKIELSNHLNSPKELRNIGEFYIFYKPNHRTTWYVLFDKVDETFLVTYIFNNHSKESSFIP